jgi:ankyrin repeat protein
MQERQLQGKPATNPAKTRMDIMPSEKPALPAEEQKRLNDRLLDIAECGNDEVIMQLIGAGADIAATNSIGKTALHQAAGQFRIQTCVLVMQEYAKTGRELGAFIAAKDSVGRTALHDAAWSGHTQICKLLIQECEKSGGDVTAFASARDTYGRTASYYAGHFKHAQTARLLNSIWSEWLAKMAGNAFFTAFRECISQ